VKNIFKMSVFGINLRKLRKEKDLTLKQLAEAVGVKHQSVEKWEKGLTLPKGKTLEILLAFLGVTANELMYEKKPSNNLGVIDAGDKVIVDKNLWLAQERELQLYREKAALERQVKHLKNPETISDNP
jgi:transcriptional regulator with XRE-family HTH domain